MMLSPSKRTTDGVIRSLSWLGTITGFPCSSTYAIAEYVVPRSIPYTRLRPSATRQELPLLATKEWSGLSGVTMPSPSRHTRRRIAGFFVGFGHLLFGFLSLRGSRRSLQPPPWVGWTARNCCNWITALAERRGRLIGSSAAHPIKATDLKTGEAKLNFLDGQSKGRPPRHGDWTPGRHDSRPDAASRSLPSRSNSTPPVPIPNR